jgi:hypothetical protein
MPTCAAPDADRVYLYLGLYLSVRGWTSLAGVWPRRRAVSRVVHACTSARGVVDGTCGSRGDTGEDSARAMTASAAIPRGSRQGVYGLFCLLVGLGL